MQSPTRRGSRVCKKQLSLLRIETRTFARGPESRNLRRDCLLRQMPVLTRPAFPASARYRHHAVAPTTRGNSPRPRRAALQFAELARRSLGDGNASANCAPSRIVPISRHVAAPTRELGEQEGCHVVRCCVGISGVAAAVFQQLFSFAVRRANACLTFAQTTYFDGALPCSMAISPSSSITGILSSRALSSFDPASSPATT